MNRPRVVLLRGHSANPWELRAWEPLTDRYEVVVGVTGSNVHDLSGLTLPMTRVPALRDRLPRGRLGDLATLALGDRYRKLEPVLRGADIVHSAELGVWFASQPATLKERLGYRLVLTVWETIPFLDTFRGFRGRPQRARVLEGADRFLAATDRARRCLLLEGAPEERVMVSPPGVDVVAFRSAERLDQGPHLVVSPGRLVWEKGHYDVLRALAALGGDHRLLRYAADLGLRERVEIRSVRYAEMPNVFARASCVVLASLPVPLWEEQFGMVLAEAMAAGAPILASDSGAIPEVLDGSGAPLFRAGDWSALADLLARGPLARPPGERVEYPEQLVHRYSIDAAAERIAEAYERVLGG